MRTFAGLISTSMIVLITVVLWYTSIPLLPDASKSPLRFLSQLLANLTLVFMSLSLIFSMRMKIFDKIFGGLDKSYKFHSLIGSLAFLLMIAHPLVMVVWAFPNIAEALTFVFPNTKIAANFGIFAVYTAIFAFTFLSFLKIPYHLWLNTHRLLGLSFMLGSIHAFLAPSEILRSPLLATWNGFFIFLGISASIYSIIIYRKFGPHYIYTISDIYKTGNILNVILAPNRRILSYLPGQFIYIRFLNSYIGTELHPFSPSSTAQEKTVRLSIKNLGDYTNRLHHSLQKGQRAEIFGPFGEFGSEYLNGKSDMIWVAGGIGITPFLSMLHSEVVKPLEKRILFYYSVKEELEAVFHDEILQVESYTPNITYFKWVSKENGLLTAEKILNDATTFGLSAEPKLFICGPPVMMESLISQAKALGFPAKNIVIEQFNLII